MISGQRRIPRCWSATPSRRRSFLKPSGYAHREGASAKQLLTRVAQRLATLQRDIQDAVNPFADVQSITLPRRAEDLMILVAHETGLAHQERGVQMMRVASAYDVPLHEVAIAIAALTESMIWFPEPSRGIVTLDNAVKAVYLAKDRLKPRC